MRVVIFCHSLISDWNHGNAHFLRGIASELLARGRDLRVYEPADAWSVKNLVSEYGEEPIRRFHEAYPQLDSIRYDPSTLDIDRAMEGAELVLVHEWNDPDIVRRIGLHRRRSWGYTLLFHDTHHRSVTDPASMSRYDLDNYDGVLAFGESIAEVYRRRGWASRVWTWHEAADTRMFHRTTASRMEGDLVWIGNWGDDERTRELDRQKHKDMEEPEWARVHVYDTNSTDGVYHALELARRHADCVIKASGLGVDDDLLEHEVVRMQKRHYDCVLGRRCARNT